MKIFEPFIHLVKGEATEHEMFVVGLELTAIATPLILIFGEYLK